MPSLLVLGAFSHDQYCERLQSECFCCVICSYFPITLFCHRHKSHLSSRRLKHRANKREFERIKVIRGKGRCCTISIHQQKQQRCMAELQLYGLLYIIFVYDYR